MKSEARSQLYYDRAKQFIPGGVNSPVRACRSVGRIPLFIHKAQGARITDTDGNEFIDFVMQVCADTGVYVDDIIETMGHD